MEIEEAISTLSAVGLRTRIFHESPLALSILGDPNDEVLDDGIQAYQWCCFIEECENCWKVTPPPILVPGPGPTSETRSLNEAIELVINMFRARHELHGNSLKEQYANSVEAMKKWCTDKDYDGNVQ